MTARRTVVAALALGLLLALVPGAAGAASPSRPRSVNMGDSYSAGAGILPFSPTAPSRCTQSLANWGHDLARDRGYDLVDVSCSGADTGDDATAQAADVPPQGRQRDPAPEPAARTCLT